MFLKKVSDNFEKLFKRLRQPWLVNSKGAPDAMLTFAFIGLVVSSLTVLGSVIEKVKIGNVEVISKSPSDALILGYLSATLGAYVLRRNKKDGLEHDFAMKNIEPPEEKE